MLQLLRTDPTGVAMSKILDATVSIRDNHSPIPDCPDLVFSVKTYRRIFDREGEAVGNSIIEPLNLFFQTLTLSEQKVLYDMYAFAKKTLDAMTSDNRRDLEQQIQERVYDSLRFLNLPARAIAFCRTPAFTYPPLDDIGTEPHHTEEKTFREEDYIIITAMAVITKLMIPIWGEFIAALSNLRVNSQQREEIAFSLLEPTFEEDDFGREYEKLTFKLSTTIQKVRSTTDGPGSPATTSYILTHSGVDDEMFNHVIMASTVVKRMATYNCFTGVREGDIPNIIVYIHEAIRKATDSRIDAMRKGISINPRLDLSNNDKDNNTSILDHMSKTSKKSIDVPVVVTVAAQNWEIPRLIKDAGVSIEEVEAACAYYTTNPFEVSPLCQAMVASFVGTRFGGSKCINYLPLVLHRQIVVILQIFLIKEGYVDLAALLSAKTSPQPIDGAVSTLATHIYSKLKSDEYVLCQKRFKGSLEKPQIVFGRKDANREKNLDKIDFVNHIKRIIEWLTKYVHTENMAPVLWQMSGRSNHPVVGSDCQFDDNIIRDLCRFYLMFNDERRPFSNTLVRETC